MRIALWWTGVGALWTCLIVMAIMAPQNTPIMWTWLGGSFTTEAIGLAGFVYLTQGDI